MRYEYVQYPDLRRAEIRWHLLGSDGSIGGSEGGWFMEEVDTQWYGGKGLKFKCGPC
jgi:hypothetical protein